MEKAGYTTDYQKQKLPSGLTLVSEYVPNVRTVSLGVWVYAGSRDEDDAESGMAHMLEHLLFKGTKTRSAGQIAKEMDALGGHLNAFTSREFTCFYLSVLDDRLKDGLELLSDIFLNSVFSDSEITLERGVILEEIKMCLDNPEDNLHDMTISRVWEGNSLSRPILGTPETVSAFDRDDIRGFFRKHYHTGKAVLTAAGHLDHGYVYDLASSFFDSAPGGDAGNYRVPPSFKPGLISDEKPLNQVYLDINLPGICQTHDLRYPAHVLNTILGGSLSSRLFQKIREEKGLVYSIYSGLASHMDSGLLHISASTSPDLTKTVVELVMKELKTIRETVPEQDEIRRAKDHLIGNLVLSM